MSPPIDDEDEVEEGQLETSPRHASRAEDRASESPVAGPSPGSRNAASDSLAKSRNRFRSRSRSRSRRRVRSRSRSKRRSGSRSPYAGPVIRDMRRGGRGSRPNRFGRGRRSFRNRSRRSRSRSPSSSRSPSPRHGSHKAASPDLKPELVDKNGRREKSVEKSAAIRQPRPEDIKNQSKADTMSFLAMLNEKKQVNKMIPINLKSKSTTGNDPEGDGRSKSHGFVSTFASLAGRKDRSHGQADGSADENDGWEVVDDARSTESPNKRLTDARPAVSQDDVAPVCPPANDESPGDDSSRVKSSKSKDKKKRSSRKEEGKKKKRKDKKRKHSASESSDLSDGDHKKQRKRKRSLSPDTKSSSRICKPSHSEPLSQKEPDEKKAKKEKKEKKKSKRRRSASVSESERFSRKKSKKKKSKKSSQKRKKQQQRKSSPSSESGSSESESMTMEMCKKTVKNEDELPSKKGSPDGKSSPTSFEFPRSVLLYTQTQPSIQYSRNPRAILLNLADDNSPRTHPALPADPPLQSLKAAHDHRSPEKRSAEKTRTSDCISGKEKGSPSVSLEKRRSCDTKKDGDDCDPCGKKKPSSDFKNNRDSKSKRDDRNSESSRRHERDCLPSDERSEKAEGGDKSSAMDSVKQELLAKAKKRKEDGKPEGKDVKLLNAKIVIGKMKQGRRAGRREDKTTPLDMNQDYSWYQQHYAASYALDPYTAAYYAQYAMLTSGDYSSPDITAWLHGYGFVYDPANTANMPLLPPTEPDAAAESGDGMQIPVLGSDVPEAAVEQFYQPQDTVRAVDAQSDEMDVESDPDCPSPPAPPPPPPPPQITNLIVEHAFVLPNGQEVPAGTKQVIVHPYPESHPLASHFTPEFIHSSLNSHQSSKCEDKSSRVLPNGASSTTPVAT